MGIIRFLLQTTMKAAIIFLVLCIASVCVKKHLKALPSFLRGSASKAIDMVEKAVSSKIDSVCRRRMFSIGGLFHAVTNKVSSFAHSACHATIPKLCQALVGKARGAVNTELKNLKLPQVANNCIENQVVARLNAACNKLC